MTYNKNVVALDVVTITFNNYSELLSTLKSLPATGVQSVVINGGDCELTKTYLKQQNFPSVSERDSGISDAFNKGPQLSTNPYITYLNSGDELIDQDYYREAIEVFEKNSEIGFVYADICFKDQFAGDVRLKSGNLLPAMPYLHPTLIVRKSIMEKIGFFNLDYKIAMDLDFAYRLVKSGAKGYYIPRMVVKMDGLGISSKNYLRGFQEVVKIIIQNKDFSFRSLIFVLKRTILLVGKLALLKLKGDKLLGLYRKTRYKINP